VLQLPKIVFNKGHNKAHSPVFGRVDTPIISAMRKLSRQNTILAALVFSVVIIATTVICCSLLPIYPDEVAYKILLERFWLNDGLKQSVTPFCSQGFLYNIPISLTPAAIFWTAPYYLGHGWASYRLLPLLAILVIVIFLLSVGLRRRSISSILTVTLICAGPSIYGLITFRPEVFILAFSCIALYGYRRIDQNKSLAPRVIWSTLLVLGYSFIAYMHPKAIYISPFVIGEFLISVYLWRNQTGCVILWLICIVLTVTIAIQSTQMHKAQLLHCSEYPSIEKRMNGQAINIYEAAKSMRGLHQAFSSLTSPNLIKNGIDQLGFKSPPDVRYLPEQPESVFVQSSDLIAKVVFILVFVLALAKIFQSPIRPQELVSNKYLSLAVLCICLTTPYILSLTRYWYDAAAFRGALTIIAVSFLIPYSNQKIRHCLAMLSVSASVSSLAVVIISISPALLRGYEGPGIALATNRVNVDKVVRRLVAKYQIIANTPLIVDDLTYEAVKDHPIVIPITYLSMGAGNEQILRSTLIRHRIEHAIVSLSMPQSFWDSAGFKQIESIRLPGSNKQITLFTVKARTK
jgi:hypothetical protein